MNRRSSRQHSHDLVVLQKAGRSSSLSTRLPQSRLLTSRLRLPAHPEDGDREPEVALDPVG
jgi:hypothetical protein